MKAQKHFNVKRLKTIFTKFTYFVQKNVNLKKKIFDIYIISFTCKLYLSKIFRFSSFYYIVNISRNYRLSWLKLNKTFKIRVLIQITSVILPESPYRNSLFRKYLKNYFQFRLDYSKIRFFGNTDPDTFKI